MPELERALVTLGQNLDYPATPNLSGAVARRLAEGHRPSRPLLRRRSLVVALAILAVAAGAAMAVPQARSTILEWFGVGGVTIRYVEELPEVPKASSELDLGDRVSLAEARRRADYDVLFPELEGLDRPRIYFRDPPAGGMVSYVYGSEAAPKLLIQQFAAGGVLKKLVAGATEVDFVSTRTGSGVWLRGQPHDLFFLDASGEDQYQAGRLVGNALVIEGRGVTYRIEADIERGEALRIAESLR